LEKVLRNEVLSLRQQRDAALEKFLFTAMQWYRESSDAEAFAGNNVF
jgi:hypothetical protein